MWACVCVCVCVHVYMHIYIYIYIYYAYVCVRVCVYIYIYIYIYPYTSLRITCCPPVHVPVIQWGCFSVDSPANFSSSFSVHLWFASCILIYEIVNCIDNIVLSFFPFVQKWMFGLGCRQNCICNKLTSVHCNPVDGRCVCQEGWHGNFIHWSFILCVHNIYSFHMQKQFLMYHLFAHTVCWYLIKEPSRNMYTDVCVVSGLYCKSRCPAGYWGQTCDKRCECQHDGSCDAETGKCQCSPGWTGEQCNEGKCNICQSMLRPARYTRAPV